MNNYKPTFVPPCIKEMKGATVLVENLVIWHRSEGLWGEEKGHDGQWAPSSKTTKSVGPQKTWPGLSVQESKVAFTLIFFEYKTRSTPHLESHILSVLGWWGVSSDQNLRKCLEKSGEKEKIFYL